MRRRESKLDCLIAVDKPLGMTSHDVVDAVRRAVGERRVGHGGTLDPDASGVLIVGIGQATKLLGAITLASKTYDAGIRFGSQTDTDDASGRPVRVSRVPARLGEAPIAAAVVASMPGDASQVPPAYSAVSKNGRRAYETARAGERLELEPRHVTIHETELLSVESYDAIVTWNVRLKVSKGCYIRSVARDLGADIGCFAHVSSLRRVAAGPVTLDDAVGLDELARGGAQLARERCLDPVTLLGLPIRELTEEERSQAADGRRLPGGDIVADECALVCDGRLHGVWRRQGRWLVSKTNLVKGVEGAGRDRR